jgi:hypothetical protein
MLALKDGRYVECELSSRPTKAFAPAPPQTQGPNPSTFVMPTPRLIGSDG